MWTDGWVSVHKIHKTFVPKFLYMIMPKNSIFSPSAKKKFAPSPRPLGPLQFQSTGQNTHLTSKTVILAMLAFKKNLTHLHSNQPKLSPCSFRKLNSPPYKTVYAFPAHLQTRELGYSLSLPLEWSQVTHIPASIKSGGAYKPEKSAFYSTFARQLCDDARLPG